MQSILAKISERKLGSSSQFGYPHAGIFLGVLAMIFLLSFTPLSFAATSSAVHHHESVNITAGPQFVPSILTSPNPSLNGIFGASVAISGNIAVIGAPSEDVGLANFAGRDIS